MKNKKLILLIGLIFLLVLSFGKLANIYGEFLWFKMMTYSSVFWTILLAKGLPGLVFGIIFALIAGLNIYLARKMGPAKTHWELSVRGQGQKTVQVIPIKPEYVNKFLIVICLILSLIMGLWPAVLKWDEFLRFIYQSPFSRLDPIFSSVASFI